MRPISNTTATDERPKGLQIMLPARSENVAVVRHALAGLAEEIGMDEPGLADLKTVVTEACMNVVLHAYEGEPGPLDVEADGRPGRGHGSRPRPGVGIRPQADTERDSLRLGLSLIAALSSSFSISGGIDRGTEITMRCRFRAAARMRRRRGPGRRRSPATAPSRRSAARSCSNPCWPGSSARWRHGATSRSTGSPTRCW